jgi:hypothetical protein
MPSRPRTTTCVSRTALTATGVRPPDFFHCRVDLALDLGFGLRRYRPDLPANLSGQHAESEAWREHTIEDASLAISGQLDQAFPKVFDLAIIGSGG